MESEPVALHPRVHANRKRGRHEACNWSRPWVFFLKMVRRWVRCIYTPCYQVDPAPFSHIIIDPFALLSDSTDAVIVAGLLLTHTQWTHAATKNIRLNRWPCKQIEYNIVYILYFYIYWVSSQLCPNINTTQ